MKFLWKNKFLLRVFSFICSVMILSLSVGTKYFDANHMEKVEAGALVVAGGITAATLGEICLFVGTTALAVYGIGEAYENREEIARFGKEFIDSCGETVDGWVGQIVDTSGQDYVFGSEALDLIRDTEWSVIQGGLPPEGDPNKKDDKDKGKFHIPGDPMTHVAQFTALGATWFTTNAQNVYQDWCDILDGWVGKDTPIPVNNVLANNFPIGFNGFDSCMDSEGNYNYYGISTFSENQPDKSLWTATYWVSSPHKLVCVNGHIYDIVNSVCRSVDINYYIQRSSDGRVSRGTRGHVWYWYGDSGALSFSIGLNIPIYSTLEAAEAAVAANDFSGALNYAKEYRIADWLQQDWAGTLIDPLVNIGLSLSQLTELCRQLGLRTVQGLNAQELLDLLKNALPGLDPAIFPDISPAPFPLPVVDPSVDPIYYPDPDAHPDKPPRPVIDPGLNPKPDPDPGIDPDKPKPNPNPGTDPEPELKPDPDKVEIPADKLIPFIDDAIGDLNIDLKDKFPFCIPWDLHHLLTFMSDLSDKGSRVSTYSGNHGGGGHSREPVEKKNGAPVFRLPIVLERYGIEEYIIVDMSPYEPISRISRLLFTLMFVYTLINWTVKIVSVRKDD